MSAREIMVAATLAFLAGCSDPIDCPYAFTEGQIVYDRMTGERFIVTRGKPFTNIHTGSCSLLVETANGRKPISSFRVSTHPRDEGGGE